MASTPAVIQWLQSADKKQQVAFVSKDPVAVKYVYGMWGFLIDRSIDCRCPVSSSNPFTTYIAGSTVMW